MADYHKYDNVKLCTLCGTMYEDQAVEHCKICEDPRQFVRPSGQDWSTHAEAVKTHKNKIEQDADDSRVWFIETTPRFAIGERAIFLQTPHGNILWDMIALCDEETVKFIKEKGGLKAIVISHPHYYTTHARWAAAFDCPVYIASDDEEWIVHPAPASQPLQLVEGPVGSVLEILPGVSVIKAGGHFPGSLLMYWDGMLLIADTIVTIMSAGTPHPRPPGQTSYTFLWSIPNVIPMPPSSIHGIWKSMLPFIDDVHTTFGAFDGLTVKSKGRDRDIKHRMLLSMQTQISTGGWEKHEMLDIPLPDIAV